MLASNNNPSAFEGDVRFTATLSNYEVTPTGSVAFYYHSSQIGSTQTLSGGAGSVDTTQLPVGLDTVTAIYSGDGNYYPDTATVVQTVGKKKPTETLASSMSPSDYTNDVVFTTYIHDGSHPVTGTISFWYNGSQIGATQTIVNDTAKVDTTLLPIGTDTITAIYTGDANFLADTATVYQVVKKKKPVEMLASNNNPSTFEGDVVFTANVTSAEHPPTGTVSFYYNGSQIGSAQNLVGGNASVDTTQLPPGSDTIVAIYSGDGDYYPDTAKVAQVVNKKKPTETLFSSRNPSTYTNDVILERQHPQREPSGHGFDLLLVSRQPDRSHADDLRRQRQS